MKCVLKTLCLSLCLLLCLSGTQNAAIAQQTVTAPPNFDEHVKPVLRQYCLKCHGDDKQEADLNLQAYGALLRGGSGGAVVQPGRSSQSLLFQAITNPDDAARMPPDSPPLPQEKVELIRRWIDTGLRQSADSTAMVQDRKLKFTPAAQTDAAAAGPPVMPESLAPVAISPVTRPFPVISLDSSPRAPLLAVADLDRVRLLHGDSQEELGSVAYPEGEPLVVRFSRDGAVLLVAGGRPVEYGLVALFDVRSGKRLAEIGDEVDAIQAADLSPAQHLVALGGSGRTVKVYSTTDGELRYQLTRHTDWITAVAFSPDGTKLATADRAGGLHLWDAESGGILLNLAEHKAAVRALDWRSDSQVLASAGEDGRVVWWDVTDGFPAINKADAHPPHRPPGTYGTIPNGVLAARFDLQGNLVTSGRDGIVRLWDAAGNEQASFRTKSGVPISNAVLAHGSAVVIGDSLGNTHFWQLQQADK